MQVIPLTAPVPTPVDPLLVSLLDIFTFSPFGLGCRQHQKAAFVNYVKKWLLFGPK